MSIKQLLAGTVQSGAEGLSMDNPYDDAETAVYSAVDWQQDGLSGVRKGPDCYDGVCL